MSGREEGKADKILPVLKTLQDWIGPGMKTDETAGVIVQCVADFLKCSGCVVFLNDYQQTNILASMGVGELGSDGVFHTDMPLIGHLQVIKKSLLSGDGNTDKHLLPSGLSYESFLCSPVLVNDYVRGFILAVSSTADFFHDGDALITELLAGQLSVGQKICRLYSEVAALSVRDELTGCLNRAKFDEEIDIEIACSERYQRSLSLLLIEINQSPDASGADAGLSRSSAMRAAGKTLTYSIRMCDRLYRYGEESFALIFPGTDKEMAIFAARRLHKVITQAGSGFDASLFTINMGVASFPSDAVYKNGLVKEAETSVLLSRQGMGIV